MKPDWVCPNCGMTSTRNWNVKRHIQRFHGGISVPVGHMQYIINAVSGKLPFPTYPENIRPAQLSGTHMLVIIDKHSEELAMNVIEDVRKGKIQWNSELPLRARVCNDCLTIGLTRSGPVA